MDQVGNLVGDQGLLAFAARAPPDERGPQEIAGAACRCAASPAVAAGRSPTFAKRIHRKPAAPMESRVLLRPAIRLWHPGCHSLAARRSGVRPLLWSRHIAGCDRRKALAAIGSWLTPRTTITSPEFCVA